MSCCDLHSCTSENIIRELYHACCINTRSLMHVSGWYAFVGHCCCKRSNHAVPHSDGQQHQRTRTVAHPIALPYLIRTVIECAKAWHQQTWSWLMGLLNYMVLSTQSRASSETWHQRSAYPLNELNRYVGPIDRVHDHSTGLLDDLKH